MRTSNLKALVAAHYADHGTPEWVQRDIESIEASLANMANATTIAKVNFWRREIKLTEAPILREVLPQEYTADTLNEFFRRVGVTEERDKRVIVFWMNKDGSVERPCVITGDTVKLILEA